MNQKISEDVYLKPESKLRGGKVSMGSMMGIKGIIYFLIILNLFFMFGSFIAPNPNRLSLGEMFSLINTIRIAFVLLICLIMVIRIQLVYRNPKPWKYGLEISTYLFAGIFLIMINTIAISYVMTIYLFRSNFIFFYISLIIVGINTVLFLSYMLLRGRKGKDILKFSPVVKNLAIMQIIGGLVAGIIVFIGSPSSNIIVYIAFLLLPIICSFSIAPLILNIYAMFHKKDIDFGAFYQVIDGIDPNKEYGPNFSNKSINNKSIKK